MDCVRRAVTVEVENPPSELYAVWVSLMALKAGGKWPAVLARAAPMTPARGADEGGTRASPRPRVTPAL